MFPFPLPLSPAPALTDESTLEAALDGSIAKDKKREESCSSNSCYGVTPKISLMNEI